MVTIYTTPSSLACRKAKAWLQKNDLFIMKETYILNLFL